MSGLIALSLEAFVFSASLLAMQRFLKASKICAVCQRPFTWRKKWAKVWDAVQYCSKACRSNRHNRNYRLKYE